MTDGRTDGRTDGGDCIDPDAFLKKRGDKNTQHATIKQSFSAVIYVIVEFPYNAMFGVHRNGPCYKYLHFQSKALINL